MIAAVFHRDSLSPTGNFGGMFRSATVPYTILGVYLLVYVVCAHVCMCVCMRCERVAICVHTHAHRPSVKAKLEERDWYL